MLRSPTRKKMIDKGFQFVTVQSDLSYLVEAAQRVVDGFKESAEEFGYASALLAQVCITC